MGEFLEPLGIDFLYHLESSLIAHVFGNGGFSGRRIEDQRRFTIEQTPRVVTIERPDAAVHGQLLLLGAEREIVSVCDAMAVSDD